MCQGLEVEGLRYETGVIRVWFAENYSAHRIRSRQELQRPVSTRSWSMQTVSAAQWSYSGQSAPKLSQPNCLHMAAGMEGGMAQRAPKGSMKLQRPVSTEAVFNLYTWLHRAARLRGWRAGWRKGRLKAAWSKCRDPWSPNNNHQQALKNDLHFGGLLWGMLQGMLRGYASGCALEVCFARAPPSTNTYLGPRKKY